MLLKEAASSVSLRLQGSTPLISPFSRLKVSVASRLQPRVSRSEAYSASQQQHRVLVEVDFSHNNSPNPSKAPFLHHKIRNHNSNQEVVCFPILLLNSLDKAPLLSKPANPKVVFSANRARLS